MRNISQATYDRLCRARVPSTDDRGRMLAFAAQDVRDLLEAYEAASELLDGMLYHHSGSMPSREAEEFLYLESGEPRVHLEGV